MPRWVSDKITRTVEKGATFIVRWNGIYTRESFPIMQDLTGFGILCNGIIIQMRDIYHWPQLTHSRIMGVRICYKCVGVKFFIINRRTDTPHWWQNLTHYILHASQIFRYLSQNE